MWFFDVFSILAEKQRIKPMDSGFLKFFACFDAYGTPRGAKIKEMSQFMHLVLKFDNSGTLYIFFFLFFLIRPRVFFIDLKVMKGAFLTLS